MGASCAALIYTVYLAHSSEHAIVKDAQCNEVSAYVLAEVNLNY